MKVPKLSFELKLPIQAYSTNHTNMGSSIKIYFKYQLITFDAFK